ncbi:hypothetical protein CB0940_11120 [Cercospora beticola]|uniref:Uncharacterized protein n=1 Tax=Cercospora beticola TaxID=122368 RepID=A0A2G5HDH8_CERBT|nr:hypothetical protein CB0940_11120 [Cercospora beticola]PIA90614.1 hypothetical protein CB0940_11120 [Cercospora beticola]WPB07951.1 hypothetical protein RHO25_012615 [Cercospora beticola]CAK1368201.1 unnamed protein product [Cercospora beticola]
MASTFAIAPAVNPKFSLSGHMPANAAALAASKTLSEAIAEKAAAVYKHYHEDAPVDSASTKKAKVKRCETCKPLRKFCHHNAPIEVGSKNDVDAAAKKIFQFFVGQYYSQTLDIVSAAQAFLERRESKGEATEFVVDLVLGIVGVIQAYQTVPQPNVTIPPTPYTWNTIPKGTTSVIYTGTGYFDEVNVLVFENLVEAMDGGGPDGTEGNAGWGVAAGPAAGGGGDDDEESDEGEEGGDSSD